MKWSRPERTTYEAMAPQMHPTPQSFRRGETLLIPRRAGAEPCKPNERGGILE